MKALLCKLFILIVGIIIILTAGCMQQEPISVKMSRLVAAENLKLKEDLRQRDWEISSGLTIWKKPFRNIRSR
jgi:hypothetical protein